LSRPAARAALGFHAGGYDELLHPATKGIAVPWIVVAGDSVVDKSEAAQCERVSQQPVGVGLLSVA